MKMKLEYNDEKTIICLPALQDLAIAMSECAITITICCPKRIAQVVCNNLRSTVLRYVRRLLELVEWWLIK